MKYVKYAELPYRHIVLKGKLFVKIMDKPSINNCLFFLMTTTLIYDYDATSYWMHGKDIVVKDRPTG